MYLGSFINMLFSYEYINPYSLSSILIINLYGEQLLKTFWTKSFSVLNLAFFLFIWCFGNHKFMEFFCCFLIPYNTHFN